MAIGNNRNRGKTELVKSNALVLYNEEEAKAQKRELIGNLKRKTSPTREQLGMLLLENIQVFPEHEARLLRAVFDLKTLTAQEIMIPLSEINLLKVTSTPSDILNFCDPFKYRYIPIYSERVDRLLGVVDCMEIFTTEQHSDNLAPFVKTLAYVPPLKSAIDLLTDLRQAEIPAAIVVNEHGSCIGFVELIDILEKVVGDIKANRKRHTPAIEKLGNNQWRIDARALIVDVNVSLDTQIPDRSDTIGGFILALLGRFPEKDEKVEYEGYEFNIEEILEYRISRLHVIRKAQSTQQ